MVQLARQTGVVIGLTVVLTFPVTVVPGDDSKKHSETSRYFAAVTSEVRAQAPSNSDSRRQDRPERVERVESTR